MSNPQTSAQADPWFTVEDLGSHVIVTFTTDTLFNPKELERVGHKLYVLADESLGPPNARRPLVLDFKKVRYCASQAVGIILTLNKKLGRGRGLTLCGVGHDLIQLLRITRLDQVLTIVATREEAVKPKG